MKKHYAAPELVEYGTVAELTAALGSGGQQHSLEAVVDRLTDGTGA